MTKKRGKIGIIATLTLSALVLFGCSEENTEKYVEYETKNVVQLTEKGTIDGINFTIHSISGEYENNQQINLMVYQEHTPEEMAEFIQAYALSIDHLSDHAARIDIYDGTTVVISENANDSDLKGVPLLYVYEDGKLYKQEGKITIVDDEEPNAESIPESAEDNNPVEHKIE